MSSHVMSQNMSKPFRQPLFVLMFLVVVVVVVAHAALIPSPWIVAPLPRTTIRTGGKHCEAAALHGRGQASSWCILVPCFFEAAVPVLSLAWNLCCAAHHTVKMQMNPDSRYLV